MIILKLYIKDSQQCGTWYNSFRQFPKNEMKEKVMESTQKVIPMKELGKIIANIERFEKEILNVGEVESQNEDYVVEQIRRYRSENIVLKRLVKAYIRKNQTLKKELGYNLYKKSDRRIE